jgi:hypothetical protein
MIAQSIGRSHVASERVYALMPADIHHLEEVGTLRRSGRQKSRPHAAGAVLLRIEAQLGCVVLDELAYGLRP